MVLSSAAHSIFICTCALRRICALKEHVQWLQASSSNSVPTLCVEQAKYFSFLLKKLERGDIERMFEGGRGAA